MASVEVDGHLSSETSVEIKIKTLDSQTYTMRVDKSVPVPALKEQIAVVTGVVSEQQRLICRGKVLKDDQLLSAYHVEDGHTLHLVVRQPVDPSSGSSQNPASDPASTSGRSQGGRNPGFVVSSFNFSEQDGDLTTGRVLSALLGSLGMANFGSALEGLTSALDLNEAPTERSSNPAGVRNVGGLQSDTTSSRQPFDFADPVEPVPAPVIPDSLTTLTQTLDRLRQEFTANAEILSNSNQSAGIPEVGGQSTDAQRGLPTPASLAAALLDARQLINDQVSECLLQLGRQLEGHVNVTDASERARIQQNALRSGALLHHLGATLLELARTSLTTRMGQAPADGIVNSGPAVFISPTGPSPITVQILPFQPGTGFSVPTAGVAQPNSGPSPGSGRTIDIRIRRVVAVPASAVNRSRTQSAGQTDPAPANNAASAAQSGARATRTSTTRPSRGTMGILVPLFTRVQTNTSNGGPGNARAAAQPAPAVVPGSQSMPEPIVQINNLGTVTLDGMGGGTFSEQGEVPPELLSQLEQWARSNHATMSQESPNLGTQANPITVDAGSAQTVNSEPAPAAVSEQGAFLSNILQHIMPLIAENGGSESNNSSTQARVSGDQGSSSSRGQDEEQPEAKRQKKD